MVTCILTLNTSVMFSRLFVDIFSRLVGFQEATLATCCTCSRTWRKLHVFPRLTHVMFSCPIFDIFSRLGRCQYATLATCNICLLAYFSYLFVVVVVFFLLSVLYSGYVFSCLLLSIFSFLVSCFFFTFRALQWLHVFPRFARACHRVSV